MSYRFNGDVYDNGRTDRGCDECGPDWEYGGDPVLAIASVPMQKWRLTYSPEKALRAGTMFAELNLPFKGGKCR